MLIFATSSVVHADVDWSKPPPLGAESTYTPPRPTRTLLANGASLLVVENHALPLATILAVMPGAGSTADPAGEAGLAAYTADLLDEGAGNLGSVELARRIESLGARMSAFAGRDAAFLQVSALTRNLAPSVEIMAKVLADPSFDAREGQRVHEDRLAEIALRRDRSGAVASLILLAALYGPSAPYGHPELGYAHDLTHITVADAHAFYRTHYDPSRLIVVVAGDVDPAAVRTLLDGTIGAWRPHGKLATAAPPAVRPVSPPGRLLVVDRPGAQQTSLRLGALGVTRGDPRAYATEVMATILGGTFTSRLSRRLREELGYTYGILAAATYLHHTGELTIETDVVTDKTHESIAEILRIIGELAKTPVSDAELQAAQRHLVRQLSQQFVSNDDIAQSFAVTALAGMPDDWFATYAAHVDAVTAADVRAAAATLAGNGLIAVVVGDLAEIAPGLKPLGLGPIVRFDSDGEQVKK